MSESPRRERVSAPDTARKVSPVTRSVPLPDARMDGEDAVYARALRNSQLRLALGTVAAFVVVVAALSALIVWVPEFDQIVLWGVPLSWLLHAFAYYPVIAAFGLFYVRGAARNERRYFALREGE